MARFGSTGRIVMYGTLGQSEVFSTGFWIYGNGPTSQADAQSKINAYATAVGTDLVQWRPFMAPSANWTRVRLYWYANGGDVPATYIVEAPLSTGAGTGQAVVPMQTCIVASLRTGLLGRSGKGRMYMPATGVGLTSHQLTASQCSTVASVVKDFLAAGAAVGGTAGGPIVNSSVAPAPLPITSVIVDSRTDVQRRHADKETVLFSTTLAYP